MPFSDRFFVEVMFDLLAKDLEVYVGSILEEISTRGEEDSVDSPTMCLLQQEALKEVQKEHVLEAGHILSPLSW